MRLGAPCVVGALLARQVARKRPRQTVDLRQVMSGQQHRRRVRDGTATPGYDARQRKRSSQACAVMKW
jgi:hypothetical protein